MGSHGRRRHGASPLPAGEGCGNRVSLPLPMVAQRASAATLAGPIRRKESSAAPAAPIFEDILGARFFAILLGMHHGLGPWRAIAIRLREWRRPACAVSGS